MKDNKEKELENKFLLYVFGIWNIKNDVWNMKSKNSEITWNSWLQNSLVFLIQFIIPSHCAISLFQK